MNGSKIKGRMVEMELTQKDVAAVWDCAPPTVSQKLNGVRPIDLEEARKLGILLKLTPAEHYIYFFCNSDCTVQFEEA